MILRTVIYMSVASCDQTTSQWPPPSSVIERKVLAVSSASYRSCTRGKNVKTLSDFSLKLNTDLDFEFKVRDLNSSEV